MQFMLFANSVIKMVAWQVWFDNVPHSKLVEYKKDQNWVKKSGDYLVFPGGGTQFKDGVMHYVDFIEKVCLWLRISFYGINLLKL